MAIQSVVVVYVPLLSCGRQELEEKRRRKEEERRREEEEAGGDDDIARIMGFGSFGGKK